MAEAATSAIQGSPGAMERALKRERAAREHAEALLETKSRELYLANQALAAEHERAQRRNAEIERAHEALKSAQAQLVQSEKLASVGQLAAGVAHEINNPIGFIMSNLGTLKAYSDVMAQLLGGYMRYATSVQGGSPDASLLQELKALEQAEDIEFVLEDLQELVTDSHAGAIRVKDIVQGLKSFSRVDEAKVSDADLHAGIESTLKVVANELKYRCKVATEFGELPLVPCNLAQINQVLMNLLVNAAQAIEDSGEVTISTRRDERFAYVEIRDSGSGIPEDKLGSIFDPFFTTKPVGSGTGLGLSISYGIVKDHGGDISVESEVGVGSTFTVTLPLHSPAEVKS